MSQKQFIYLVQAAEHMEYEGLESDSSDVLIMTWKKPSDQPDTLFYPESTWNEGRNRLLEEAKRRCLKNGTDYLYYIFMDEDCMVKEDTALADSLGIELTGNPYRTFEQCLLKWMPAVGYTRYDWQFHTPGEEVDLGYNFDANFNAFHRDTLDVLLPYYTGFDAESWLYSQLLICHLCALLYNSNRLQFNVLQTDNLNRQGYQARKKYWHIPTTFLLGGVRSQWKTLLHRERPNNPEPLNGTPQKKQSSYRQSEAQIEQCLDITHPYFAYRSSMATRGNKKTVPPLRKCRVALCMSGSCRGLTETWQSFKELVLDNIGEWDLFMYVPEDEHARAAQNLEPKRLQIVADSPIEEGEVENGLHCRLKTGLQPYLQQLNGLQKCFDLMEKHVAESGAEYDLVIRCRPDLLFVAPVSGEVVFDPWYVHLPDFHQFEGCNDRFAVGSVEKMRVYMSQIHHFHEYMMGWRSSSEVSQPVTAEMYTAGHLRCHGIPVRLFPFRFHRVRSNRVCLDAPSATLK